MIAATIFDNRCVVLLWIFLLHLLTSCCFSGCFAFSAIDPSSSASSAVSSQSFTKKKIPITVLGGFLGSGKTTLLQNLLENNEGLRIAVIVNDVASVNIDSKLVKGENRAAGMVELQNGCACCSRADELLASVSELVTLSDMRGEEDAFDHVVIELSGVADPRAVRSKFQEAVLYDMPLMERVNLDTMVTLVDPTTFIEYLESDKLTSPDETPELYYRDEAEAEKDQMWGDMPPGLIEALRTGERSASGPVSDLLVSQTEVADIVLLTKVDIEVPRKVSMVRRVVEALNPRARIIESAMGRVLLSDVLAVAKGEGVVEAGLLDDHRDSVSAVEIEAHSHTCNDPDCSDMRHSHDHQDASEERVHLHLHHHSHSHEHSCSDPDCTDPSHDDDPSIEPYAGIGSFVYRARRPFHPGRLLSFLSALPVKRGLPEPETSDFLSDEERKALRNVIRSKGFCWVANSSEAALYWSHAGSSFELAQLGRWWTTLPREEWPVEATEAILQDFDDINHDEGRSLETVGDRRQEIVFIGPTLSDQKQQRLIIEALDMCLLSSEEWYQYCEAPDEEYLDQLFPNRLGVRHLNF